MSQSNRLLLNPESTVPEETSHYDCNNLEDIAKTKQIAKQKKDTKTTISALEKQSQKLKRTHLIDMLHHNWLKSYTTYFQPR